MSKIKFSMFADVMFGTMLYVEAFSWFFGLNTTITPFRIGMIYLALGLIWLHLCLKKDR